VNYSNLLKVFSPNFSADRLNDDVSGLRKGNWQFVAISCNPIKIHTNFGLEVETADLMLQSKL